MVGSSSEKNHVMGMLIQEGIRMIAISTLRMKNQLTSKLIGGVSVLYTCTT